MMNSLKLVCVGDGGVGKTCFLKKLCNVFEERYIPTESRCTTWVDVEYQGKKYSTLDTAGQEKYGLKSPFGWNEADVFLVMFDLTNSLSYKSTSWWVEKIKSNNSTARIILVGAKCESESRKVLDVRVHHKYLIPYVEISSKNNIALDELFAKL
jgi:small GTP-binding protein